MKKPKKKILTWRDVMDCKHPGMHIDDMAKLAEKHNYRFFCHNGRVYSTTSLHFAHDQVCLAEGVGKKKVVEW